MIWIDKSGSPASSTAIKEALNQQLRKKINDHLNYAGDKVQIGFIHNNTQSRDIYKQYTIQARLPNEYQTMEEEEQKEEMADFERKLSMERGLVLKHAKGAMELELNKANGSTGGTDIWSTINIANDFFNEGAINKEMVFLCDMIENTPRSRQFHKFLPKDNNEARTMATVDYNKLLESYPQLKTASGLNSVKVSVWYPRENLDNTKAFGRLEPYWRELFGKFQMTLTIQ